MTKNQLIPKLQRLINSYGDAKASVVFQEECGDGVGLLEATTRLDSAAAKLTDYLVSKGLGKKAVEAAPKVVLPSNVLTIVTVKQVKANQKVRPDVVNTVVNGINSTLLGWFDPIDTEPINVSLQTLPPNTTLSDSERNLICQLCHKSGWEITYVASTNQRVDFTLQKVEDDL